MSREDAPEPVGYKQPPRHSRFPKGRSGNPSGRRKGLADKQATQDDREIVLSQLVPMTIGGKRVKITARRAIYQKLLAMSFEGNLRAMALLLKFEGLNDNATGSETPLTNEQEHALIERFLTRRATGGSDDA